MKSSRFSVFVVLSVLSSTLPTLAQPQLPAPETAPQPSPTELPNEDEAWLSSPQSDAPVQAADEQAADEYEPTAVIGINQTSATDDDLVRLGDSTPCLVRLENPRGVDITVVINNTDGRLDFNGQDSNGYITLQLPGDGSPVPFTIIGKVGSSTLGNAEIKVHANNVYTPIIGRKGATVFYFDDAKASVSAIGGYTLSSNSTSTGPSHTYNASPKAIDLNARVAVKPSGVNTSAPQLSDIRVGLVQNMRTAAYTLRNTSP